jgi:hypothetical protein
MDEIQPHFEARNIAHFITCARKGKNPGASGGEKRCYDLARMLRPTKPSTLFKVQGLDTDAFHGFVALLRGVYHCKDDELENILRGI